MSRSICFRAWHDGRKEWLHDSKPPLGGCHILGETIWAFGEWCRVPLAELDQVVVEQFTGLKDRDGNEIYEGDIVGHPIGTEKDFDGLPCPNPTYPHSWWERGEVKYYPELARFGLGFWSPHGGEGYTGREQAIDTYISESGWVVLGNIHENPELLNP